MIDLQKRWSKKENSYYKILQWDIDRRSNNKKICRLEKYLTFKKCDKKISIPTEEFQY